MTPYWRQPRRPEAELPAAEPSKPDTMSERERQDWLETFKDVEDGDVTEPI